MYFHSILYSFLRVQRFKIFGQFLGNFTIDVNGKMTFSKIGKSLNSAKSNFNLNCTECASIS